MTAENLEAIESELEEGLESFVELLTHRITSPVKRAYARQLLLSDFNNTLPRGIYMDNEVIIESEGQ